MGLNIVYYYLIKLVGVIIIYKVGFIDYVIYYLKIWRYIIVVE